MLLLCFLKEKLSLDFGSPNCVCCEPRWVKLLKPRMCASRKSEIDDTNISTANSSERGDH